MKFQHTRRGQTQNKNKKDLIENNSCIEGPKPKLLRTSTLLNSSPSSVLTGPLLPQGEVTDFNAPSTWREGAVPEDRNPGVPGGRVRGKFAYGFTLIELLVVVLIIGILTAIALPHYQKSVERSKATQGLTLLKTLAEAYQAAYLTNGSYPSSFAELDINFPFTGKEHFMSHANRDSKSNSDWILEIEKTPQYVTLYAARKSGKYKGAGFLINFSNPTNSAMKLFLCFERTTAANFVFDTRLAEGAYCQQVMQGTYVTRNQYNRSYSLP